MIHFSTSVYIQVFGDFTGSWIRESFGTWKTFKSQRARNTKSETMRETKLSKIDTKSVTLSHIFIRAEYTIK